MELQITNLSLIESEVLERKVSTLQEYKTFQNVKDHLKEVFKKDFSNFNHRGISYNVDLPSKEQVELYVLEDDNSLVSLIFGLIHSPNGTTLETARFRVTVPGNETTVFDIEYDDAAEKFIVLEEKTVAESAESVWKTIKEKNQSGLIEELETSTIQTKAFGDGCLPGGYQYCGQKCGNCSGCTAGGGGPIYNKVDGCCRIHDYCYSQHKTQRCINCDKALVSCVRHPITYNEGPVAASSIITFFRLKCNF